MCNGYTVRSNSADVVDLTVVEGALTDLLVGRGLAVAAKHQPVPLLGGRNGKACVVVMARVGL